MKSIHSLLILLLATLFLSSCQEEAAPKKPNILFIIADDFGYHDTGVMGSKFYETPNIDRIANEGMLFTDGYAACQVCSPSRASIMTGMSPARHGITDWIGAAVGRYWRKEGRHTKLLPPAYNYLMPQAYTTMPEALKEVGYKTFFTGKWHIGDVGSCPQDHGFDVNVGGWESGGPRGGYFSPWNNPVLPMKKAGENLSMRLANETIDFIKANQDTSFFAFLSFYAVHSPIQTSEEKWAKYRKKAEEMGIAEEGFEMAKYLPIRQVQDNPVYGGLVETMDDAVGEVLNALKEMGLDDNTIVIFTSDNGGVSAGDDFTTSNLPLRGGKGYQFEGGIREPFFIKVPGLTNGQTCSTPVIGTDFYPTLLELAGGQLKPNSHADGVSLVPLLNGGTIAERPLFWHYPHYGNQGGEPSSVIRQGDWKLIHYYEDGREELYNIKSDISETTDVKISNPALVKQMSETLFAYLNKVGARFPEMDDKYDAALERQHLDSIEYKLMPQLEKYRMEILQKDFHPTKDWWGSKITID